MVPLDDFLSRLMPYAPGCPHPVAQQALLDACIDFCERTLISRSVCMAPPLEAGVADYEWETPAGTEMVRVLGAWVDKRALRLAPRQMVDEPQAFEPYEHLGEPTHAWVATPRALRLYPAPDLAAAGQTLTVYLALKPSRCATCVQRELFSEWAEGIVAGALLRLASMPGQGFSSLELAAKAGADYQRAVGLAKLAVNKGRTVSETRVRPRRFSRGAS